MPLLYQWPVPQIWWGVVRNSMVVREPDGTELPFLFHLLFPMCHPPVALEEIKMVNNYSHLGLTFPPPATMA